MKKGINIIHSVRRLGLWIPALFAGVLLSACADEKLFPDTPKGDQAVVTLTVSTPKPSLPKAATRAQTEAEANISQVRVLVFGYTGGDNTYKYMVSGNEISSSESMQTKFKVQLTATEEPLKLIIVANANDAFTGFNPQTGTPESVIRTQLNAAFTSARLTGDLPMFGEALLPDGVSASEAYTLSVTALRAVARVDVVKDLADDAPEFILEEVYAFRANDMVQLVPNALADGSTPKVTAPSVPAGAQALALPVGKTVAGGTESIIQIYIPESTEAVTGAEKITGATTIVVGGRFGGGDSPVSYYRADFDSGLAGHPFGQVLRNYRYIFNIKQVSSEGWGSPEQAANNMAASMLVDVQAWEDFSTDMYYGDDKLAVSSRSISLRWTANRERRIDVESTQTYEIQWLDPATGNPVNGATSLLDDPISNGVFEARIARDADDDADVTHIVFRTLTGNHIGNAPVDRTLRITAGRWQVNIAVSQDNSARYSDRIVRILSVAEVGNLGIDQVAPDASGLAMRKVLDVQFAPTGVIRIGGSSFTRIPNTLGYLGTSTSDNLTVLKRILGAQDVIYLPYNLYMSSESADLILDWLRTDYRRVLIFGFDNSSGSKLLREKEYIAEEGTFGFSPATVSTNYVRASATPDTGEPANRPTGSGEFFDGPFGAVAENAAFSRIDATAGYMTGYGDGVIPLIAGDNNRTAMFMGVNPSKRIVYFGDGNLFQNGRMSNDNGTVSGDLDRLMANTWAWIMEQVIYGNE